jgi:hypothetical protein
MIYSSLLIRHCYPSGQCFVRINGSIQAGFTFILVLCDAFELTYKLKLCHQVSR